MLVQEKQRVLELEKVLEVERKKNEDLVKSLKVVEKESEALKVTNVSLQEKCDNLQKDHNSLKVQFEEIKCNTTSSQSSSCPSSSNEYARCHKIDIEACTRNITIIDDLKKQVQVLEEQAQKKVKAIDDAKAEYARGAYTNAR